MIPIASRSVICKLIRSSDRHGMPLLLFLAKRPLCRSRKALGGGFLATLRCSALDPALSSPSVPFLPGRFCRSSSQPSVWGVLGKPGAAVFCIPSRPVRVLKPRLHSVLSKHRSRPALPSGERLSRPCPRRPVSTVNRPDCPPGRHRGSAGPSAASRAPLHTHPAQHPPVRTALNVCLWAFPVFVSGAFGRWTTTVPGSTTAWARTTRSTSSCLQ